MGNTALGERVATGNLDFDVVWNQFHERVYRWVYAQVRNARDAEDLTSRVFIRVWKRRKEFDPSRSSLCHWIHLNTQTVVIGHFRAPREDALRLDLLSEEQAPPEEGPEETHATMALADEVRGAIDRLPGMVAAVMRLRHLEGRSWVEIGLILGMTPRNAQYLDRRGRELLHTSLAGAWARAGMNPPATADGPGSFRTLPPACGQYYRDRNQRSLTIG